MSSDEERMARYAKIVDEYNRRFDARPNDYKGQKNRIEEAKRSRRELKNGAKRRRSA